MDKHRRSHQQDCRGQCDNKPWSHVSDPHSTILIFILHHLGLELTTVATNSTCWAYWAMQRGAVSGQELHSHSDTCIDPKKGRLPAPYMQQNENYDKYVVACQQNRPDRKHLIRLFIYFEWRSWNHPGFLDPGVTFIWGRCTQRRARNVHAHTHHQYWDYRINLGGGHSAFLCILPPTNWNIFFRLNWLYKVSHVSSTV